MNLANHRFLGLPASKPRVWIDLSSVASKRAGLSMHSPGRNVLKIAVKVLSWFAWLPIEKIVRGTVKRFDELDGHEMIEKVVCCYFRANGKIVEFLTLYMGNDSAKSKLTVKLRMLDEEGKTSEEIVKLGRTTEAAEAITNEVTILKKLAYTSLCAQVPTVIGEIGHERIWTWSVQTVLPKGKSPTRMQKEHFAFLDALRKAGISHGDFAPWNCSIYCGKLYVWDWEDAEPWVEGKDENWFRRQVKDLLGVEP